MTILETIHGRRRVRAPRFDYCNFDGDKKSWSWMVFRCRTWMEVEQVLNLHAVDWDKTDRGIWGDGWEIVKL